MSGETLREKLAESLYESWEKGDCMDFAADRIARLLEGGHIVHGEDCPASFPRVAIDDGSYVAKIRWRPGDESTCTCGLAEALGMRKEK